MGAGVRFEGRLQILQGARRESASAKAPRGSARRGLQAGGDRLPVSERPEVHHDSRPQGLQQRPRPLPARGAGCCSLARWCTAVHQRARAHGRRRRKAAGALGKECCMCPSEASDPKGFLLRLPLGKGILQGLRPYKGLGTYKVPHPMPPLYKAEGLECGRPRAHGGGPTSATAPPWPDNPWASHATVMSAKPED